MTDYLHPLSFGSFTTPGSADPAGTVELARTAERAGLDLVTFQDHPYQPSFLDTATLLSFVAARTSVVHLAANVTNLPLRPPAVLARSVASLDLLSGGRVELGLGAGGFWDAMAAMGARRLTPGESVRALEEAIDVIRQVWDTEARGGVRSAGEFYSVNGAKRGPAPAHDIAIWLGSYKRRMLELTGRRADGWLPSLAYLQPGDLADGNAVIDEAALEAGRSPGDVRRLLNVVGEFSATGRSPLHGPAEQWAEELADLALTNGISTFILASDDPDDLRRFGGEVAPAVRELVADERAAKPRPVERPAAVQLGGLLVKATPDDGVRRSATRVWDESTRPHRPHPGADRVYPSDQQANAQHLVDVHDTLRGELARILDLVDQVSAGLLDAGTARSHINALTVRQNKWTLGAYCESYCRTVGLHHLIEDQSLFPSLRRRVPGIEPVIDRLEDEHRILSGVLEDVDRTLVAFVSAADGGADLRAAVDLLSDTLLSHLAYEEGELVEPIARTSLL